MFGKKKEVVVNECTYTATKFRAVALQWVLDLPFSGLFLKPGLGKTGIALEAFRRLKEAGEVDVLLVAAKSRIIYSTWPNEIDKWSFPFSYHIMHEDKAKISCNVKKTIINSMGKKVKISVPGNVMNRQLNPDADVWLINYEGFEWLLKELKKTKLYKHKRIMCVIDESSKIGKQDTIRFRKLYSMVTYFTRRHILTGSPAANGLLKIFPQIKFLDMGAHFGTRLGEFRLKYFSPCGFKGYQWKVDEVGEKRIFEDLKDICISFGEEELDLPPLIHIHRPVLLPENIMALYNELEKEHVIEWQSKRITAETAAVKSMKLRQVASGGVYDEDGIGRQIHTEKIKEIEEIIEESQEGSPILVAFEFKHEMEAFKNHKPFKNATFYSGKTGLKEGKLIEEYWNEGHIPLLFGQLSSIAHGLNLQESGYTLIIYTLTFDLEAFEQLLKRLHRPGQKKTVRAIHLIAEGTVDETVFDAVQQKDFNQQRLFDALLTRAGKEKRADMIESTTGNAVNILRQHLKVMNLELPPYATEDKGRTFCLGVIRTLTSMGHIELQNFIYSSTKHSVFNVQSLTELCTVAKKIVFKELGITQDNVEYFCNVKTLKSFKIKIVKKVPSQPKPTPEYMKVIKDLENYAENKMKGKRSKELDKAQDVDYSKIEGTKPKVKRPRAAKVDKSATKPAPPKTKPKSSRAQFGKRKPPFTTDKEAPNTQPKKRRGFGT